MSSRNGRPITPPANAPLTLTAAESSGSPSISRQTRDLAKSTSAGSVKCPPEGIGRRHGTDGLRTLRIERGQFRGGWIRIACQNDRLDESASCWARFAEAGAILAGWKTNQHGLQRLQIERKLDGSLAYALKGNRRDLVPHGVPAFGFAGRGGTELELPGRRLGGSDCRPGTRLVRP